MNAGETSLAEQRRLIRGQLDAQRQLIKQRLAPVTIIAAGYPRSATMRLLMQQPALLARVAARLAGVRFAPLVPAVVILLNMLRAVAAGHARKALPAPPERTGIQ